MPLRNRKMPPSGASKMLLAVWQNEWGEISGVVRNDYLAKEIPFDGTMRLVAAMESIMEEMQYPQAYELMRSFSAKKPTMPPAPAPMPSAAPGTSREIPQDSTELHVQVISRRNATWQGVVTWPQKDQSRGFESELEFFRLIYGAVSKDGDED